MFLKNKLELIWNKYNHVVNWLLYLWYHSKTETASKNLYTQIDIFSNPLKR